MPYKDVLRQKESHRNWHLKNRDKILSQQKKYRLEVKKKVFAKYCKGVIRCGCCGEKQIEFLSIDHISGGGTKHRSEIGRGYLYFWLVKNNFPDGYRVLCHNCNQALGSYGKCPHQELKMRE